MTGKQIKALREKLGLTQESLARLLDVSLVTVARWEIESTAGPRGPALTLMDALDAASRVDRGLAGRLTTWKDHGTNFLWARVFELAVRTKKSVR